MLGVGISTGVGFNVGWPRRASAPVDLIQNGTFDTDTWWTKAASWTISGGKAVSDGNSGALSTPFIFELVEGADYLITLDVERSGGGFQLNLGGTIATTINTSGAKSVTLTMGSSHTKLIVSGFAFNGTLDNITLTRV